MAKKKDDAPKKGSNVVNLEDKKKKLEETPSFESFITKNKISAKDDIPTIHYKKEDKKLAKETVCKGKEKPLDDFIDALQDLDKFCLDICEIKGKEEDVVITGVSFSGSGVVITAQIELTKNGINAPLCLNSPHVVYESSGGGFEIPAGIKEKLTTLKQCAIAYIQGDRAEKQQNIFAEG